MRILLFDRFGRGHHAVWVRHFAEALTESPGIEVVAALPDVGLHRLAGAPVTPFSLGEESRPTAARTSRPTSWITERIGGQTRKQDAEEMRLFRQTVEAVSPDRAVHMFADGLLDRLALGKRFECPVALCLFRPSSHYPACYGDAFSIPQRLRGWAYEACVRAWRRRPDAGAILTLDETAAHRWAARGGAPAYCLPEPPVENAKAASAGVTSGDRSGCVLYGDIDPRKGLGLIERALGARPFDVRLVIAGSVAPSREEWLRASADRMTATGATVDVRARRWTPELEALETLARARCTVLPYVGHIGPSGVLVQSASVGTPVVAHDEGLLGHLVRHYELGLTVDCRDPGAFSEALERLSSDPDAPEHYRAALQRFASRFEGERFGQAVRQALACRENESAIGASADASHSGASAAEARPPAR